MFGRASASSGAASASAKRQHTESAGKREVAPTAVSASDVTSSSVTHSRAIPAEIRATASAVKPSVAARKSVPESAARESKKPADGVQHSEKDGRFFYKNGAAEAHLLYSTDADDKSVWINIRTIHVPDALRGRRLADHLAKACFDFARENKVSTCRSTHCSTALWHDLHIPVGTDKLSGFSCRSSRQTPTSAKSFSEIIQSTSPWCDGTMRFHLLQNQIRSHLQHAVLNLSHQR